MGLTSHQATMNEFYQCKEPWTALHASIMKLASGPCRRGPFPGSNL